MTCIALALFYLSSSPPSIHTKTWWNTSISYGMHTLSTIYFWTMLPCIIFPDILFSNSSKAAMTPEGIDEIIDSKIVEKCNLEEVRNLAKIAHRCVHKTPRRRPTIGEISRALIKIQQRHLVKEDNMSFMREDLSRVVSQIEFHQVELRRMCSIDEGQNT